MHFRLQLVIEGADGVIVETDQIASLERVGFGPATAGLTLNEAKSLLAACQKHIILAQARDYETMIKPCPACVLPRSVKSASNIVLRTLFGSLTIPSQRLYHCRCACAKRSSFSPIAALFPERSTPELVYLQTKWASLMSYGLTCDLLADILPLEHRLSPRSVRRQLHRVANRLEADLGDEIGMINTQSSMPDGKDRPPAPMTVGLDGGYVHAREGSNRKAGWFEVMVGKSVPDIGDAKCFAMVQSLDTRPRRRLGAVLDAQGLARGQSIHFVSDGGDTVRNLQLHLHGEAEHWLDWFHITMRITVMRQMAKSIVSIDTTDLSDRIDRDLARIKRLLWHGNHVDGAEAADLLTWDLELADNKEVAAKLGKALGEFSVYIRRNADFITNYGDKWRNGERISSGFTESAVNQVLSRRMVKKQQMRWTKVGAHLLLQTRTQTLNGDLRRCFQRWYPDMKSAA